MIDWTNKEDESWEGVFQSSFFHNDENQQDLSICIEKPALAEYAEKCVESFNNLPEAIIDELCKKIIKCAKKSGFNPSELENDVDILKHCWFTMVYVTTPKKQDSILYVVEGEGEWGEEIGFVIKNNKLAYVGINYFKYLG